MIQVIDDTIQVNFQHFDLDAYEIFLQSKHLPEYNLSYDWESDSYLRFPQA